MQAIIKTQGHQYKVKVGDELLLPVLKEKPKAKITFDQVLLVFDDKTTKVGLPTVTNAKVKAEVIKHLKDKKIRVAKFRTRSRYRKVQGHRTHLTLVKILSIVTRENKLPKKTK